MDVTMLGLKVQIQIEHFEHMISTILRVPGIYILNYYWKAILLDQWPTDPEWPNIILSLVTFFVICQGMLLQFLHLESLITLYMHYLSAGLLVCAEWISRYYVLEKQHQETLKATFIGENPQLEMKDVENLCHFQCQLWALALHIIFSFLISYLLDIQSFFGKIILAIYAIPVVAGLANVPSEYLLTLHNCTTATIILIAVCYFLNLLPGLLRKLYEKYDEFMVKVARDGTLHTVLTTWTGHYIPSQFIVFGFTLFLSQLYKDISIRILEQNVPLDDWYITILFAIAEVCSSPLCLVSMCITISWFSSSVIYLTRCFIYGEFNLYAHPVNNIGGEGFNAGLGEGVTFALLAVQTGLIDLKMPQRLGAMSIILFIVIGSLIQSMYETAEPALLALAASHNHSLARHCRALTLILLLLVAPLYMAMILYQVFDTDFWTLVVMSTCALTSVQVLGTLIVYALFAYDALLTEGQESWEGLDDVVYIARASTRCLEFSVAVFVVAAGIRESLQGDFSCLNAVVLLVHCYCNVWNRLQMGWRAFLLRREAVRKVTCLPEATAEELQDHDDVCAICYMDMLRSARRTYCKHFFHSSCLRKWLYIQDRCPLCGTRVCQTNPSPSTQVQQRPALRPHLRNPNQPAFLGPNIRANIRATPRVFRPRSPETMRQINLRYQQYIAENRPV